MTGSIKRILYVDNTDIVTYSTYVSGIITVRPTTMDFPEKDETGW